MPDRNLPHFQYHPDPLATGSVEESEAACVCCGEARGYIYVGPVYAQGDYGSQLCPWCIADGRANATLGAEFTDSGGVGGYGAWDEAGEDSVAEVVQRTPGFNGWQQEQWFTHCGDAAAFVGRVGYKELQAYGAEVSAALRAASDVPEDAWPELLEALDKDGAPTGYLFRCVHCGTYGGYTDMD